MVIDLRCDCELIYLTEETAIADFDCGDADLNDFFNREALLYQRQMLSETIFYRLKNSRKVVCAFSFSASSIKTADLPGSRRKKVLSIFPLVSGIFWWMLIMSLP